MSRKQFNTIFAGLATSFALYSLICAYRFFGTGTIPCGVPKEVVIAFWTLMPPLFFWADWVFFCGDALTTEQRDAAKHTHDLGRNIWLGLLAVLIGAFHLNIFNGCGG